MPSMDRDGGALFSNTKKTNQNSPDFRGELRISREVVANLQDQLNAGVQFPALEIAGWKKQAASGTKYMSLSGKKPYVSNNQQGQQQSSSNQSTQNNMDDLDDDIPF